MSTFTKTKLILLWYFQLTKPTLTETRSTGTDRE